MGKALAASAELATERALRIREAQLAEAMALASLGTWEWDIANDIVSWSPELRRIIGVAPDVPASVRLFMELIHPEDRAWAEKSMRESLRTGYALEVPFRIVRPDGTIRVVRGRATTSGFADGKPVHMVGAMQDLGSDSLFPDFTRDRAALHAMSKRERQVVVLVAQGGTSKEIAQSLDLSPKTVETYRSRVMSKIGVDDVAGLVRFSVRHRLVAP